MYFRRKLLCGTACLVAALQAAPSFAQPANTTQDPAKAPQTSPDVLPEGEVENVVVTAQRGPNSVPGDAVPETTLDTADIAALGASSVSEILAALGPRTGSGRGRGSGQPVILLNGRRISSFREVQGLAPEAILRVEVFPEATALQYGYSADQRVINFILKDQFRAITVEGTAGYAAEGDETSSSLEIGSLQISKKGRLSINVAANQRDSITEAERKVVRTTTANDGAYRTLTPETSKVEAGVTYNRNFGKSMSATFDLRADQSQSDSLLGLAVPLVSGALPDPLRRSTTTDTQRAALTVNGTTSGWQWTGSGSFDTANTDTATRSLSLPAQTSKSESQVFEAGFNATGPTVTLPAGPARASVRLGYLDRGLDSFSQRLGVETRANLSRSETTARGTFAVPITSRRAGYGEKFGDISLNFNGSLSDVSDFGSLQGGGLGINWSPTTQLRLSLAYDSSNTAPSIQQLGNPQLVTPASPVFDFKTGQTVLVNRISGGNPTLKAESRADKTFSANYSFKKPEGLDFQLSYAVNSSENTAASFPVLTPALEAAYPTRFVRNSSGILTSIDQRPINYAKADSRILRYGLSFSKGFGPVLGRGGGMGGPPGAAAGGRPNNAPASGATAPGNTRPPGPGQGRPDAAPASRQGQASGAPSGIPSGFGGFGGGRGGPPPGAMMAMFGGGPGGPGGGGGGGQAGRWTISVFHTIKLEDTLVLAPGLAPLDLLEGDAVDDNGGSRRHSVELAGAVSFLGIGMRGTGEWRGQSKIIGTNTLANGASNLYFDDVFTLNLRAFAGLDMIPNLTTKAPFLKRSRVILRIDNLLDSAQKVRDGNGVTPEAYQKALQAPRGRSVEFSWRKQF